jgi:hypothetical protein
MIFTRKFWRDTAERTISSAAQGAITGWGTAAVFTSVSDVVSAAQVAGFGALSMAVLTFLKCLVASNIGDGDSAALLPKKTP